MSQEKRRFIRFSLDIPMTRFTETGETVPSFMRQVSVGGCLSDWDDSIRQGDQFRIEIQLPNKNKLPLMCKAIYRFTGRGIGIKFHEITQFEQALLAQIISESLEQEGLPMLVDPFTQPPKFDGETLKDKVKKKKIKEESAREEAVIN